MSHSEIAAGPVLNRGQEIYRFNKRARFPAFYVTLMSDDLNYQTLTYGNLIRVNTRIFHSFMK